MIDLLREVEGIPAQYPDSSMSNHIAVVDKGAVWQRIESYTRTRYSERPVEWTIEAIGASEWDPPLSPVVSFTAQHWDNGSWSAITLQEGPLGIVLPFVGTFKISATVGAGPAPLVVNEAFSRICKYFSTVKRVSADRMAMRSVSEGLDTPKSDRTPEQAHRSVDMPDVGCSTSSSASFLQNWSARSLQLSGAADLLRPYKRIK